MEEEIIIITKERKRLPVNEGSFFSGKELIKALNKYNDNGVYSLEPGGQLEWSSFPYKSLIDLSKVQNEHKKKLNEVLIENDLEAIGYGVDPIFSPEEVDLIDEIKYELMNRNMEKSGSMGKWMMRNTASVQINFDYVSEKELEEIVFVADCVNPVSAFLFSNSPFINGEKVKIYSNSDLFVKDMVNKKKSVVKDNLEIVPISCVMYLQPSYSDDRLSSKEKEESFITSCCLLSDEEIDNFIKGDTI